MIQNIPAYLVEAVGPPPVVALCTVCGRRTIRPTRAMMDRHGSVITDGCGDCPSVSATQPARIEDDGLGPIFIATDHGVIRGWGDLTPQESTPPGDYPRHTPGIPRLAPPSPGYAVL